jgi:hypothetical protein
VRKTAPQGVMGFLLWTKLRQTGDFYPASKSFTGEGVGEVRTFPNGMAMIKDLLTMNSHHFAIDPVR